MKKNYPIQEIEKFLNHYSKTGWKDKNGNQIEEPYAAAKNWTQLDSPLKYFMKPEYHKLWEKFWENYKANVGFEKAKHLLKIKPQISSNTITFICEYSDRDICETNIEQLKHNLRSVFGIDIKLEYKVLNYTNEKAEAK